MRLLKTERREEIDLVIDPLDIYSLGLDRRFAPVVGIHVSDPENLMPLFGSF